MKTIKISALLIFVVLHISTKAQETTSATPLLNPKPVQLNCAVGIGTFAAGDNMGGSVFWGGTLSADWTPNQNNGLSYGFESGLLGGETQGSAIYGIPAILRFGWHPGFLKFKRFVPIILVKTGWAFGIWNSHLEKKSSPNGAVGGINFGGTYSLAPSIGIYTELGYTYFGLARSRNHPEYPLGYGSGKFYASIGFSYQLNRHQ